MGYSVVLVNTRVEELLADLRAATEWPRDIDVMQSIQAAVADTDLDLTPLVSVLIGRLDAVEDWSVQEAAKTLGAIGDESAVDPLCNILRRLRTSMVPSDFHRKGGRAAHAQAAVAHEEDDLRHDVIRALQAIGNVDALPVLTEFANNDTNGDRVRRAAEQAIVALGGEPGRGGSA